MKKYEVLSPVGDIENFYTAINAGADAVYMGLNKFNARMKADNISLDNLSKLVSFAHLKDVKVYITLNTLLSDNEFDEMLQLVGECLKAKVDAFIVQDMGIISLLKSAYPSIVLHGSTQMGIHNIRGAKVAKELGLSRIVLARECTIEDIEEIANNVDIELEVFVQGAMCICFSGNCYISSLKCSASGNRGECKQLCRLPYTLFDNYNTKVGYALSPRDNCMLDSLSRLCAIGVKSFKIEGRLKHSGYVGITTNIYREAVDCIEKSLPLDISSMKDRLYRVFSRGKYIDGYNNSKNIIDMKNNNHKGIKIGKVISCKPFKNIYRITLQVSRDIHKGDGLKFEYNNTIMTMGVGNIEYSGTNTIVYAKNYIHNDSIVYLSLDSEFENNIVNYSRYTTVKIKCIAKLNSPIKVEYDFGDRTIVREGAILEEAKSMPITKDNIIKQLTKLDKECYQIDSVYVDLDNVFLPLSQLNELRRQVVNEYESDKSYEENVCNNNYTLRTFEPTFNSLAIVDENTNILNLANKYDALILSPKVYSIGVIDKFKNNYSKYFNTPLFINLPIICRHRDLKIIDSIVERFLNDNVIFVANNIYALDYISLGAKVWAGTGLNITNSYSLTEYLNLGVKEAISSIEKWQVGLRNMYKRLGKVTLMTLTNCPYQTLYNKDCSDCKYSDSLRLKSNMSTFDFRRYRIAECYFELVDNVENTKQSAHNIFDLR